MASIGRPFYKLVPPESWKRQVSEFVLTAYSLFFRKNYVFLGVVFVSAFGVEIAYDTVTDRIWDSINKGRQWKDIRARYIQSGDGDEDEDED